MKKFFAFLLIATGILAFSSGASANYVAKVGLNTYSSLSEAVSSAPDGATVTLLSDVELTEGFTLSKDITIDGTDKKYKITDSTGAEGEWLTVAAGESGTVKNLTVTSSAKKTYPGINVSGTLTVTGCDITGIRGNVGAAVTVSGGTLNINGGTKITDCPTDWVAPIYVNSNKGKGVINIGDAEFSGNNGKMYGAVIGLLGNGETEINLGAGTVIKGNVCKNGVIAAGGGTTTVNISQDAYVFENTGSGGEKNLVPDAKITLNIKEDFEGKIGVTSPSDGVLAYAEGDFSGLIKADTTHLYGVKNADGTVKTAENYSVSGESYTLFDEAYEAASGTVLTVLNNSADVVRYNMNKPVTIDGNGLVFTANLSKVVLNDDLTLKNITLSGINFQSWGGSLTLSDGALIKDCPNGLVKLNGSKSFIMEKGSRVENASAAQGGVVYGGSGSSVTIAGTITGCTAADKGAAVFTSGTLTLSDGAVITGNSSAYGGAIYTTGKVNIEGSVKIYDNTCTGYNKKINLQLYKGATAEITGEIKEDSVMGVTESRYDTANESTFAVSGTTVPSGTVLMDGGENNYTLILKDGSLYWVKKPVVSMTLSSDSGVYADKTGVIRFITEINDVSSFADITEYGTWIYRISDEMTESNTGKFVRGEETIGAGDTYGVDLSEILEESLGEEVFAISYVKVSGLDNMIVTGVYKTTVNQNKKLAGGEN